MNKEIKPIAFCGVIGGSDEDNKRLAESFNKSSPDILHIGVDHETIKPLIMAEIIARKHEM